MANYVAGPNPYQLPEPPPWWLQALADYDKQLLVFPSQKDRVYRLCRRVRREAQLGLSTMKMHTHPDTVLAIQHGAVPITSIFPWAVRSYKFLRDLRARDTWADGRKRPEQIYKSLEEAEQAEDARRAKADGDELDYVSGEAYRSLKIRKGEAIFANDKNRGRQGRAKDPKAVRFAISDHKSVISRPSPAGPSGAIVLTDA